MDDATTPSQSDAETLPHENIAAVINATPCEYALAGKPDTNNIPAAQGLPSFLDGGWAAWSTVAGGWCCMFVSLGWINSIGVFQTIYETDQLRTYSPSAIAWILSLQTFVIFGGAPFFGKVFDNYGPRYLLFGGTLFHVFGLMMVSLSNKYYQVLLAQSICSGLGASAIFYASTNSIATWFRKNRALALGIASSGSATGGVIIPIMVRKMYIEVGFGWALRTVAFIFLALLAIANVLLRSFLKPDPKPYHLMDFVNPLKEPCFILVSLACFMIFLAIFLPGTFIVLDAVRYGMSLDMAFYLLAISNGASAFGRIIAGKVADMIGRFNCMIIVNLLSTIFVLGLWIPSKSNAPFIVFAALIGFTSGAFVAMVATVIGQISEIRQIDIRNGTNFFIVSFAALVGNPIAGVLIDLDKGGYLYVQVFSGIALFVGTCLFVVARVVQVGPGWKKI